MRSNYMKTKKILGTIALAFAAAFAAPVNGETLTGDIVDVRVLGTNDMEHSFTAGEEIYIRVRMLVENHDAVRADEYGTSVTPLKWSFFETGTASTILNPPRLGLWIGDKPAYADYTYNGPESWQKSEPLSTDDAGDATPPKNTKYASTIMGTPRIRLTKTREMIRHGLLLRTLMIPTIIPMIQAKKSP